MTDERDLAGDGDVAEVGEGVGDGERSGDPGIIRVVARLDVAASAEPPPDLAVRLSAAGYETVELAGALFDDLPEPVYVWVEDDTAALVDAWGRLRGLLETNGPFVHHVFLNDGQLTVEARAAAAAPTSTDSADLADRPEQVALTLNQHPGFDPARTAHLHRGLSRVEYLSWWDSIVTGLQV